MFYKINGREVGLLQGGRGWSFEDLADFTELSDRTLRNIVKLKTQRVARGTLYSLASAFDCSVKSLVSRDDEYYDYIPDKVSADRILAQAKPSDAIKLEAVDGLKERPPIPEMDLYIEGEAFDASVKYRLKIALPTSDDAYHVLLFQAELRDFHLLSTVRLTDVFTPVTGEAIVPIPSNPRQKGIRFQEGECYFVAIIAPARHKKGDLSRLGFLDAPHSKYYPVLEELDLLHITEELNKFGDDPRVRVLKRPVAFVVPDQFANT